MGKKSNEELALEWSEKNKGHFSEYSKGSHYRAIWQCDKGHEWSAELKSRYAGYNCPYCSGRRVIRGENDLQTKYPEIAKEWHSNKNGNITPADVKYGSSKKFWWECCYCGHEWQASVSSRTRGKGCPVCHHKAILPQTKIDQNMKSGIVVGMSLEIAYPTIAAEWDDENNVLTPDQVLPHSNKIINWKCKRNHRWSASVNARTRHDRPNVCPYCAGKRAIALETDITTTHPHLIKEWDFDKNEKSPEEYLKSSKRKVFWRCENNHSYRSTIADRTRGKGCPKCKKNRYSLYC